MPDTTEKFHPNNELGEGRFSTVYKGWIDEQSRVATKPGVGTAVAVKRFNKHYPSQSDQDWLADMDYFGQLNHENLVKYIGYCLEGGHRLLVYEFMPRGSLANHLFISERFSLSISFLEASDKSCSWCCKGLAYLHSTQPKMINVYFKSSNILIDSDYNAKLSDFGFDKKKKIDPEFVGAANAYEAHDYLRTGRGG
uniref:Protein kinase domain-containing protein n=1 Tax=Helianthus annuus TaxID=4232 RepID=A0A251VGH8_HELAN